MAKLTVTADIGDLLEAMEDMNAALHAAVGLPDHIRRRLDVMARDSTGCEAEYSGGVMRFQPSGEWLAVLALVRGYAAVTT